MPKTKFPKRLTQTEFDKLIQAMPLSVKHTAIAQAVLVEGQDRYAVAEHFSMSYVSIAAIADKPWQAFLKQQTLPPKRHGFKWSYTRTAWVRQINHTARVLAKTLATELTGKIS